MIHALYCLYKRTGHLCAQAVSSQPNMWLPQGGGLQALSALVDAPNRRLAPLFVTDWLLWQEGHQCGQLFSSRLTAVLGDHQQLGMLDLRAVLFTVQFD
jgi:hypothetical protein